MIAAERMTDAEFETAALDLRRRELGADGLALFLILHRAGDGDYRANGSKVRQLRISPSLSGANERPDPQRLTP